MSNWAIFMDSHSRCNRCDARKVVKDYGRDACAKYGTLREAQLAFLTGPILATGLGKDAWLGDPVDIANKTPRTMRMGSAEPSVSSQTRSLSTSTPEVPPANCVNVSDMSDEDLRVVTSSRSSSTLRAPSNGKDVARDARNAASPYPSPHLSLIRSAGALRGLVPSTSHSTDSEAENAGYRSAKREDPAALKKAPAAAMHTAVNTNAEAHSSAVSAAGGEPLASAQHGRDVQYVSRASVHPAHRAPAEAAAVKPFVWVVLKGTQPGVYEDA